MHKTFFEVRDSEIDAHNIVCNTNYSVYFSHARCAFLKEVIKYNIFDEAKAGRNLVSREICYKFIKSLTSFDKFYITTDLEIVKRTSFNFIQNLYLEKDNTLYSNCTTLATGIISGERTKIAIPELIQNYLNNKDI